MLKLTNSFYRFLRFTCDKGEKIRVRRFTHLNCKGITCSAGCVESVFVLQPQSNAPLHKRHRHRKKHLKIKIPPFNLDDSRSCVPMNDHPQPTAEHVSYGGNFNVSNADGGGTINEWRRDAAVTAYKNENLTKSPIVVPPNFRVWEAASTRNRTVHGTTFRFKVLSYNVLAQYLLECHPYLYTECTPHNLKWNVRASRLYDEITSYSPDIFCLQEVQVSHLSSFYSKFEQIGYFGIFKQKTGHRQDGCAIYFKKSLFEMKDHVSVEFYQPELPILNRDNIGIMVKVIPRHLPDSPIVIATTHLLYNPKRTDVRLAQMQVFLAEIDRFAYYSDGKDSGHLPIILTGDFNSTPDSAIIKLLDRGRVRASSFRDSSDWTRIGVTDNCQHLSVYLNRQKGRTTDFSDTNIYNSEYSENNLASSCDQQPPSNEFNELFNSGVVRQGLRLTSVYDKYKSRDVSEATTFQDYWITVDYIYFSCCSSLNLVERLRLPTAAECEVLGCLPNDIYGSDHLALAATFELVDTSCRKSTL